MEKNYVDEIMCCMQGTLKKAAIVGFGPLPMRVGVAGPYESKAGCDAVNRVREF